MASSDNLASIEPWTFRTPLADSWISEAFARDTETLTKALQKSLSNHSDSLTAAEMSPFFAPPAATAVMQSLSGSGSDPETPASRRRSAIPVNGGKPTKRKSRASKRTATTFITADPANFRQMVQQVTGVRFGGNAQMPVAPLLKPEPQRPVNRMQGCLPTLDTSAFLLDHHQLMGSNGAVGMQPSLTIPPSALVADGVSGFDFDSFSSFPTLESWKVM